MPGLQHLMIIVEKEISFVPGHHFARFDWITIGTMDGECETFSRADLFQIPSVLPANSYVLLPLRREFETFSRANLFQIPAVFPVIFYVFLPLSPRLTIVLFYFIHSIGVLIIFLFDR
jgi:hypothetical protein